MVSKENIKYSLASLGLGVGDSVIFHSSLKSFGTVERGADDVIDAFLETVTESGTVLVPTFCQKNFDDAYNSWNINKPSDTGYITEVFRKRSNAVRSNQATHSVCAIGRDAVYYTENHGLSGKRIGKYGDTPFAQSSPWQKMFDRNDTVVLAGVDFEAFTFKHLYEYMMVERALANAKKRGEYDKYRKYICSFETRKLCSDVHFWPHTNTEVLTAFLLEGGFVKSAVCGNATLLSVRCRDVGKAYMESVWSMPEKWYSGKVLEWFRANIS